MSTAKVSRTGLITGLNDGGQMNMAAPDFVAATPVISRTDPLNLASGDNAIPVPTGATIMWFTPNPANTQALILKGNSADTGLLLDKTNPQTILLSGASQTVHINAAGTVNNCSVQFA